MPQSDGAIESRVRHIRIPDSVWLAAAVKAKEEGETISVVVRRLLRDYVAEQGS